MENALTTQVEKVTSNVENIERTGLIIVSKLKELKEIAQKHGQDVRISKTVGSSTGAAGGIGLLLAPFTGGISLVVSAAALLLGTVTTFGATIGDVVESSKFESKVKSQIDEYRQQMEKLFQNIEMLNHILSCIPGTEIAAFIAKGTTGALSAVDSVANFVGAIEKLRNMQKGFGLVHSVKTGEGLFLGSSQAALEVASNVTASMWTTPAKVGGKGLIGFGIALDALDVVLTWTLEDANVSAIDKAVEAIEHSIKFLKEYKHALKAC